MSSPTRPSDPPDLEQGCSPALRPRHEISQEDRIINEPAPAPPRDSILEQIRAEHSAGRIHPDVVKKLLHEHEQSPGADLDELICRVITPRSTTRPSDQRD